MKLNFDQLAAELTALPEEKLAKIKGGDGYQSCLFTGSNYNNAFFGDTGNNHYGGYYYYTPGYTTTTPGGPNWNSNLGTWSTINYGGSTTTTSGGYWSYVPGGSNNGGGSGGGGGSTSTGSTSGVITDPDHMLQQTSNLAGTAVLGLESQLAHGQLGGYDTDDYNNYHTALMQVVKELDDIKCSGIDVRVQPGTEASTTYDVATHQVVLTLVPGLSPSEQLSLNAHEIHHVTEYLNGQTSFDKQTGLSGKLYDITDEMASYQLQHVLHEGLNADRVDLLGHARNPNTNYQVSAADVIALDNVPGTNTHYGSINQTETNIHTPANGNTPAPIDNLLFTDYFIYH